MARCYRSLSGYYVEKDNATPSVQTPKPLQGSTKILLPIGIVAILGLGAVMSFGPDDGDEYPIDTVETPLDPEVPDRSDEGSTEFVGDAVEPRIDAAAVPVVHPSSGMGVISGRIAINTRIIETVGSYTVVVQEDVNMNGRAADAQTPFFTKKTFKARFSKGSPYFDMEKIPFSKHPYKVSVIAHRVNGTSQHTYITAESPTGSKGNVQLSLTPGAYFAIRLRDQRQIPRPKLPVRMVPVGESLGKRETKFGESDRNGHVLFEDVVKGNYEIHVGHANAPLAPPEKVIVYHAYTTFDHNGRPKTQGALVTVPDGHDVTVVVYSRHNYRVENAELKAWQLEIKRYHEFKGTTDRTGTFVFKNVPYGVYQLSVQSEINGLKDLKFKVEKDKPAPTVEAHMSR